MCVVGSDEEYLYLFPLTSFEKKTHKQNDLLKNLHNFGYTKLNGPKKNGFIMLNQCYKLKLKDRWRSKFSVKFTFERYIDMAIRLIECKKRKIDE